MSTKVAQFDTSIEIVTPENIAFRYRLAGPFRRLGAYLIDLVIQVATAVVTFIVLAILCALARIEPTWAAGIALGLWFVLLWFYGGLFEAIWNGQTPGKRVMQIRVVTDDGQPINSMQAVLRNLLRAVDMMPLPFYLFGLIAATFTDRFQRLGDLAAGTMVVVEERQAVRGPSVVRFTEREVDQIAELIPANFQASRSLARALATYAQRRRTIAPGRRMEIAQYLGEPLRIKLNLPPETNSDLLLCAVYQHTFFTQRAEEAEHEGSPFSGPVEKEVLLH